ncbi:alpha-E domain-containing protein [Pseudonocardia sp. GCM10023141]|uniref:alpha-E domain-containing protein n=1 Tax=Pseudonocardia sp. GCM10023141 TaxID=3252653 RepID=UPI0036222092
MLLSRFAESLYWAGRYLERAEATARMVKVHTELFLDLPSSAGVGWWPLLAVTGASDEFLGRNTGTDEEAVIAFLSDDPKNRGSILASIAQARANLRVSRVVLPRAAWEVVNDLHGWAVSSSRAAIDRRSRFDWMDAVIADCQLLTGTLAGTMNDDEAYAFLQIGRHMERADMTIRVLDVQAGILMASGLSTAADQDVPYADVTWMSVLRSLSAHEMYRRIAGGGMSGPEALRFLLQDPRFPRSVEFCLTTVSRALVRLPRASAALASGTQVRAHLGNLVIPDTMLPGDLHDLADDLELGIGALHDALARSYFRTAAADALAEPAEDTDRTSLPAQATADAS